VPLENLGRSERERIIVFAEFSPFDAHSLLALLITLGSILRLRLNLQLEIKLYIKGKGHIVVTAPGHFPALGIPAGLPLAVSLLNRL
jgi:hypothetical protein